MTPIQRIEKAVVQFGATVLFLLVFALLFNNVFNIVQGRDVVYQAWFSSLAVAIPVTGGALLNMRRLKLYQSHVLIGQPLDIYVTIFLIAASFATDATLFLAATLKWTIGPQIPLFVTLAYAGAHILQHVIGALTSMHADGTLKGDYIDTGDGVAQLTVQVERMRNELAEANRVPSELLAPREAPRLPASDSTEGKVPPRRATVVVERDGRGISQGHIRSNGTSDPKVKG